MTRSAFQLNRWRTLCLALLLGILLLTPFSRVVETAPAEVVTIQFLNVSDWHAQLDPLSAFREESGEREPVGGASFISSYWQADRASNPNTITLTGGDAFGASPPLSSYFQEEPGVKAMRMMGFDVDTLGNHNFDRGIDHLRQMVELAGKPTSAEEPGQPFHYVSANLRNTQEGQDVQDELPGVEPYRIFDVAGVKVAVIGITNPEAPSLVTPGNFGNLEITDPVAAADQARQQAAAEGAQVFVVITHMGVSHVAEDGTASGALIDFANAVQQDYDLIIGDHTDMQFEGVIKGAQVVENFSKGRRYARIEADFDTATGTVTDTRVEFVDPWANAVEQDADIEAMLQPYREQLAAELDVKIGEVNQIYEGGGGAGRGAETALGNLVADALRLTYGTQLGFTNAGGIRTSLPSSYMPQDATLRRPEEGYAEGPPYDLVVGDIYAMLPFGNAVVTREVTGELLWQILEHSVAGYPASGGEFGQISGFRFTFDPNQPAGSRVQSVELEDGTPIEPDATTYTFATNDFLNAGGDDYTMLADGEGVTRELMAEVVRLYIEEQTKVAPTVEGRIRIRESTGPVTIMLPFVSRNPVARAAN